MHAYFLLSFGLLGTAQAAAEPAWVSDQFEIMLRTGPSTNNAIELMVSSGTQLDILEADDVSGYSKVRTVSGTEGWVLSRYLMSEAPAREQLASLTSQLTSANTRGSSLNSQLAASRAEYDASQANVQALERDNAGLEQELADIRRTAANALTINDENIDLHDQVAAAAIRTGVLEQENRELESHATRYWFVSGGLVLVVGIILGFWLPRMRWQRKSRYDRF